MLFDSLNEEFHLEKRLINKFPSCFLFHKANQSSDESKSYYYNNLNEIVLKASSDLSTVVIVSNTSIKNNIVISIAYIHTFNSPLKKTIHHAINVTTVEAKLFAIRCGINQAIQIPDIFHIIIITNALYVA